MTSLRLALLAFLLAVSVLDAQVQPAPLGLDFSPIEKAVADDLRNSGTPGGAVAIVQGDRVIYSRGFGVASVETNEPVRPEMLFRLGSTTKMFTAAALVALAEQGKLDLKAPVSTYVSGLSAKVGRVTADQLLSHTSGFFDEAPMTGSHDETALEKEVRSWTDSRFFTEPGKVYSYSNPGYWFSGFLIEHASGRKYADQLHESLFAPLGMTHTTLRPLVAMTFPLAQGHEATPQGPRVIRPAANNAASWPAGSIFSSVVDLSRFVIAFMNDGRIDGKQVLSPAVIRSLSTPHASLPGSDASYGYGLQVGRFRGVDMVSHGGSRAGYGSSIQMVPSRKYAVITVANRTGVSLERAAEAAMEIGLTLQPRAAATTAAAAAQVGLPDANAYAGSYSQGPRTIEIMVRDGSLVLKQETGEQRLTIGADGLRLGGGGRWIVVRGANGAVEYLHAGGRSWRKVS